IRARSAASGCSGGQRHAQHPLLLLELADRLDEDVLRGEVELSKAVHPSADPLGYVGKTLHELAGRRVGVERPAVDGGDLAAVVDRRALAVGCNPERDGALSGGVGALAPRAADLVQLRLARL